MWPSVPLRRAMGDVAVSLGLRAILSEDGANKTCDSNVCLKQVLEARCPRCRVRGLLRGERMRDGGGRTLVRVLLTSLDVSCVGERDRKIGDPGEPRGEPEVHRVHLSRDRLVSLVTKSNDPPLQFERTMSGCPIGQGGIRRFGGRSGQEKRRSTEQIRGEHPLTSVYDRAARPIFLVARIGRECDPHAGGSLRS